MEVMVRNKLIYIKKGRHLKKMTTFLNSFEQENYLTSSLNFLPAENAGTVLAAIFKAAPV